MTIIDQPQPAPSAAITPPRSQRSFFAVPIAGGDERRRRKDIVHSIHIGDDLFQKTRDKFDDLMLSLADRDPEAPALVLRGPPGCGKTHILKQLAHRDDMRPFHDDYGPTRPLLYVRAPAPCSLATLGAEIIFRLTGKSINSHMRSPEIWVRARTHLYNQGVRILMIDEMHHSFHKRSENDLANLMATIKCLMQGAEDDEIVNVIGRLPETVIPHPIGVVMAGLPIVKDVIATDFQLHRRCVFRTVNPLGNTVSEGKKLRKFLEMYAGRLGFDPAPAPDWTAPDMTMRFLKASGGYRGRIAMLVKNAAILAINRGMRQVDDWKPLLAEVYDDIYEVADAVNPFLAEFPHKLKTTREPTDVDYDTRLRGKKHAGLLDYDDFVVGPLENGAQG